MYVPCGKFSGHVPCRRYFGEVTFAMRSSNMDILVLIVIIGGVIVGVWASQSNDQSHRPSDNRRHRVYRPATSPSAPLPQTQNLPPIPSSLTLTGKAYVIDGDTIRVQKTKIRLAGIDAPELNMPWGQKSKWAMVGICKGQVITVKLDGERSHDRLVGTCFLPDGRDIGAEIIKLGLALDLPHFSDGKYRHLEPEGARKTLGHGKFGHASIRVTQHTRVRIQTKRK